MADIFISHSGQDNESRVGERNSAEIARVMASYFHAATNSSRCPGKTCSTASAAAQRRCSTFGQRTNLTWATCRVR